MAQPQGVFAAALQGRDLQIGIRHSFNGSIPSFIAFDLLTNEQTGISGDLKIQAIPEIALGLNRRNGLRSDHIVDQHMTGSFIGGDPGTVKVPEQINIAARFLQGKALLRPAIAGRLDGCIAAGAEFKDALVVQALTVNPRIGIKGDDGTCRQLLAEIDPEGGPEITVVAQLKGIFAAVFRSLNSNIAVCKSTDDSVLCLALAGEHQFLSEGFKIQAVEEIKRDLRRLLVLAEVVAHQIINIDDIGRIFSGLLMLHKFDSHIPGTG